MTIETKIAQLKEMDEVAYINIWKGKRAYINLTAFDRSCAGDRNRQFYIDLATGNLVSKMGKGLESSGFTAQHEAVSEAYNNF